MNDNQNTAGEGRKRVRTRSLESRMASVASDVFSPLLMATYAMAVALWLTPMNRLPTGVRGWSTAGVFFITALIPGLTVYMLMRAGKVSDASISDRRERPIPFLVSVACYVGASFYVGALHAPRWLVCFLVAAAAVAVLELIVSLWWKISAHTGAAGGLAGFVFWLGVRGALIGDPLVLISIAILLVGVLGWARLVLRRHTVGQVLAGALLGFGVEFGMLSLI